MKKLKKRTKRINWKERCLYWEQEYHALMRENAVIVDITTSFEEFAKFYKKDLDYLDRTILKKLELILLLLPEHLGRYDEKISAMIEAHLAEREGSDAGS